MSWGLCRDFSDILRGNPERSAPELHRFERVRTKHEVVHDIGYDDLEFCLLDGVEGEQCFREGLGQERLEFGFEFVE